MFLRKRTAKQSTFHPKNNTLTFHILTASKYSLQGHKLEFRARDPWAIEIGGCMRQTERQGGDGTEREKPTQTEDAHFQRFPPGLRILTAALVRPLALPPSRSLPSRWGKAKPATAGGWHGHGRGNAGTCERDLKARRHPLPPARPERCWQRGTAAPRDWRRRSRRGGAGQRQQHGTALSLRASQWRRYFYSVLREALQTGLSPWPPRGASARHQAPRWDKGWEAWRKPAGNDGKTSWEEAPPQC